MLNNRKDFFNIRAIFVFLSTYFIFIPFIFSNYNLSESLVTFLTCLLGFSMFLVGYRTKRFIRIRPRKINKKRMSIIGIICICLIIYDFALGFFSLFHIGSGIDYTASFKSSDYTSLYKQILELVYTTVKYYIFSLYIYNNKRKFYIVFLSQIIFMITSSTRLIALYPFIVFIIYGYYQHYIIVNYKRILLTILLLPFVFVILLISRGANKLSYVDNMTRVIESISWDSFVKMLKVALESFQSYHYLIEIINNNFIQLSSGVFRMIFMFIPRSVWDDKPDSISRLIAKEYNYDQYVTGGGSVATIFGDAFINGHVIGIVILLFILGYFSKIIVNTRQKNKNCTGEQKSIIYMYYSLYIFQFIFYIRGFFSESIWKMIIITFVFYCIYKITYYRYTPIKL